eukprot:TRINITY_DN803_c0_g1_i1.p1 TRINITY_DN803_c0_g1~~TRINITY_DN803_c0_g1_i1.p1  ORF type:complete len:565 (-),score=129.49 TRINITY_DN803_c0_g1_i1:8-1702(-)
MGSPITEQRKLYAALNNCAFVSTENLANDPLKPFTFLMDASMLGVGVGFDTKGANSFVIPGPKSDSNLNSSSTYLIPDSREGWVESVRLLLQSLFCHTPLPTFDYSSIRPAGSLIKGFGGESSGPESLQTLHSDLLSLISPHINRPISVSTIVDIMNMIGRCVVSGNVRRTAEIAFGDPNLDEYLDLKNYSINPHRLSYGWTSNNSVFATIGMDYSKIVERIHNNGEPGIAWLTNMQNYSRMKDSELDHKDSRARGGNPCLEQTLEPFELCCLVETFPNNHTDFNDYEQTLKYAFLYAKTVTLGTTHWPETNRIMLRNRRIGTSMSGIAQFLSRHGIESLRQFCNNGYKAIQSLDKRYSEWLAIPQSIKTTSIKPSGTVSLLAGATPGMHYPIAKYYIRRVRVKKTNNLLPPLIAAGYKVEDAVQEQGSVVVEFPVAAIEEGVSKGIEMRKAGEVGMWEQLGLAAFLQEHWADNQVSCTVSYDKEKEGKDLKGALEYYQYRLKGVSFLPYVGGEKSPYPQMPYEEISEEEYKDRVKELKEVQYKGVGAVESYPEKFCDSTSCSV